MNKYTLKFAPERLRDFNGVLSRLEEGDYVIVQEPTQETPARRSSEYTAIVMASPEIMFTFRMGIKGLIIKRERTEEELAEEQRIIEERTVRVSVNVDTGQ